MCKSDCYYRLIVIYTELKFEVIVIPRFLNYWILTFFEYFFNKSFIGWNCSKTTFCSLLPLLIRCSVIKFWMQLIVSDICLFVWLNYFFWMRVAWKGSENTDLFCLLFFFQIKPLYKVLFFIQPTKSKRTHYKNLN